MQFFLHHTSYPGGTPHHSPQSRARVLMSVYFIDEQASTGWRKTEEDGDGGRKGGRKEWEDTKG